MRACPYRGGDIEYINLFSNTVYMGSDVNGMPITAFKSLSGGYHLEGEKAGLTIYTFNLLSCFGPNDDIGLI